MRCIPKSVVEKIYTHEYAIADCEKSFAVLAERTFTAPVRTSMKAPLQDVLLMPSVVMDDKDDSKKSSVTIKILSIVPGNKEKGLPLIPGKVLVYDDETGALNALIDGFIVTFKRTGAVAGTSAKILHPAPVENVVIFGCGAQGYAGLDSIIFAHPEVKNVTCFDYFEQAAISYVKNHIEAKDGRNYSVGKDTESAIRNADVIHCATTSLEPLFKAEWVKEGAHISAIGAYKLDMHEIPNELWNRPNTRVFVDDYDAMREEAGDLMDGVKNDYIKEENIHLFGNVINKKIEGRQNDKQITILKVVGHAVQDNIAAKTIFRLATEQNEGTVVDI